jgi:6-phosphogluconolactonase (cycloisomerase 2 family)
MSVSRRSFLKNTAGAIAVTAAGGLLPAIVKGESMKDQRTNVASPSAPRFAYVGCYTTKERNGHGKGLAVYRIDPVSREWTQSQTYEIVNPSFLAFDRNRRFLYTVHGDETFVSAFSLDQGGQIRLVNQQTSGGKNAVHLSVDPSNRFLLIANYSSGTLAVFPINPDGSLGVFCDQVSLPGTPGPHKTEQTASHPHDIPFDPAGRFVVVPDKGLDKVFVFRFDASTGKLIPATPPSVATRSGAGPRHVGFHPTKPVAYVINELDSSVTTYRYDSERGTLQPVQIVPALPTTFTGDSVCAEIVVSPSGKFVYGSNRGHDSITIFGVDDVAGTLTPIGWEPTQGKTPRFITIDPTGDYLYAANQDSDIIVTFRVNHQTGKLIPTGQVIRTGSPCCILFV